MIPMAKKNKQKSKDSVRDIKLKSLRNYEPYLPIITNSICYACGKTSYQLWHQLKHGIVLKHLCQSCFLRWSKFFRESC
jgi:hypothetical protein